MRWHWLAFLLLRLCRLQIAALYHRIIISAMYSELTKTSTALPRLAVLSVLSAARRLILIFVNSLYSLFSKKGYLKLQVAFCLANQYNH